LINFDNVCRSLKSNVQANGLYKRPQLLHLQLDTGGVVMTSAQVAEQIKSIFPLFYIQGRSSRVIIDLRCSSFFIMQTDMLYTKKRKSLNYWNSRTYNFVFSGETGFWTCNSNRLCVSYFAFKISNR